MAKIIKLAIIAFLLYLAYTEGLPLLRQLGDRVGGDALHQSGGVRTGCVGAAERASDRFGERVGRVSGPGTDPQVWDDFRRSVDDAIYEAQSQCDCRLESCDKAREALSALGDQLAQFDERFRTGTMAQNPVSQQTRIHRLLGEAQELARQGR